MLEVKGCTYNQVPWRQVSDRLELEGSLGTLTKGGDRVRVVNVGRASGRQGRGWAGVDRSLSSTAMPEYREEG